MIHTYSRKNMGEIHEAEGEIMEEKLKILALQSINVAYQYNISN